MSGRAKGARGEREAIRVLRAAGLDARGVKRERGARPDVDAIVFLGAGYAVGAPNFGAALTIAVQVKRSEDSRLAAWIREGVGPGRVLMVRRNRGQWSIWYLPHPNATAPAALPVSVWAAGLRP